jgi:molecular chaperone HscB
MTTSTDTTLCINCGKATAEQLVCPGCGVVASPAADPDYFALFDLPRKLTIDLADLTQRYYALSRRFHPDLFSDRAPAEQVASLRLSAQVNRAYQTLKDPVGRGLYWLALHGESLGRDNERVPAELAALVFDVQEKLEELRSARAAGARPAIDELREVQRELRMRMQAFGDRLAAHFADSDARNGNGTGALTEIKRILSEIHYLRTLLRDVDKELEPAWNA